MSVASRGLVQGDARHFSAQDHAYQFLRGAILSGQLQGGVRLRQEAIARHLQISRIPVRDAIGRLHAEGLVAL
ncbi:MAG: GntR family transcriptional regulator, partial [Candidatus Limnocylindrales bacterium]